jgi:hypothetical protein
MSTSHAKAIARTNEDAPAAFVQKKDEIDAMLTRLQALSDDHFGHGPEDMTWAHVGRLEHYAGLFTRITDSALRKGEHTG